MTMCPMLRFLLLFLPLVQRCYHIRFRDGTPSCGLCTLEQFAHRSHQYRSAAQPHNTVQMYTVYTHFTLHNRVWRLEKKMIDYSGLQ